VEPGYILRKKYLFEEIAGQGGMAVVWRATLLGDLGFRRTVAIKQMHPHLSESKLYVDMFAEEARVGAELHSPNIPQIYDFIHEDGEYFLVMEWVEGLDLGSYIRHYADHGVRTRWELVTAIGIGVLRALAAAHERERDGNSGGGAIVHRDISPHNILVNTKGVVKLIDFGLSLADDRSKELTEPGVVKGKMSYLSPEILLGQRPSAFSDQFATGSVLWEALVGRKLFDGPNDFDVYTKVRNHQVQPLRPLRRDVPKSLITVINRALSAQDGQRYPSAREMARNLGIVLKEGKARKDLHELLAKTVVEARSNLDLGRRTGEVSTTTPVADLELLRPDAVAATKAASTGPEVGTTGGEPVAERQRGLLHRMPFFGRRRRT
jgi:serine/threonine-protein kinase